MLLIGYHSLFNIASFGLVFYFLATLLLVVVVAVFLRVAVAVFLVELALRRVVVAFARAGLFAVFAVVLVEAARLGARVVRRALVPSCCGLSSAPELRWGRITSW